MLASRSIVTSPTFGHGCGRNTCETLCTRWVLRVSTPRIKRGSVRQEARRSKRSRGSLPSVSVDMGRVTTTDRTHGKLKNKLLDDTRLESAGSSLHLVLHGFPHIPH